VFEAREQGESHGAIVRIAYRLGVHREAWRNWVRHAEAGHRNTADSCRPSTRRATPDRGSPRVVLELDEVEATPRAWGTFAG
jgi:transposase-like protein